MTLRKILVTVVGHVDHGKTSLLDKIRQSAVATGEAGAITQAIGVSIIPLEIVKKICGKLLDVFKNNLTVPGLLTIDTPGHAAFTSLRQRGGSLADIAILVVDINEGFKPQTIESIEILRSHKVPFITAVNKIDLLPEWKYDHNKLLLQNISELPYSTQGEFEKKMYELVAKFNELGLQAERFDRVQNYTQQIALVPISAKSGQGIPELLMVLTGLAQKYLEQQLKIDEDGPCKGTILEVKEEKGLGTTVNAIIYNGSLKVNDTLIIGAIGQPLVVKVRALLEPADLADMRDQKVKFKNVKLVTAATGVKIVAPGLDQAISGMPFRGTTNSDEIEIFKAEIQQEVGEIVTEDSGEEGVMIKADTIGGLEALRVLLKEKNISIASASLGDLTKKDLSKLETIRNKDPFFGVLLGFNIKIPAELEDYISSKQLKIITNDVIYKTIEDYESYINGLRKNVEIQQLSKLVRPCKILILKGYVFRQNNPAIVGVEIEVGQVHSGSSLISTVGKVIGTIKSMKEGQEMVSLAMQGKQIAMAINGATVGRQIHEGDTIYTDISEDDFKKLKELKKHLTDKELIILKEIAEIKRKDNPVWGVG